MHHTGLLICRHCKCYIQQCAPVMASLSYVRIIIHIEKVSGAFEVDECIS